MKHPFGEAFVAEYNEKKQRGRLSEHYRIKRRAKKKAAKQAAKKQKPKTPFYPPGVPFRPDGSVDYHAYILSPVWAKKRKKALRRAKGRCETCGKAAPLQVHHKNYRHLGCERHMDVIALCDGCHSAAHEGLRGFVLPRDDCSREFQRMVRSF